MKRYFMIFEGIVQGVGFRYTAVNNANRLNLIGYVRNANNGNVEIEVQGLQENIDEFLKEILKPRTFIQIFDYQIRQIPLLDGETAFTVRR